MTPMFDYDYLLDPGHGGKDPGAGGNGHREKDWTLKLSLYMYDRLRELGARVGITRTTDVTLEEEDRVAKVLRSRARYCISNHLNAGGGVGCETIHSLHSNGRLAKRIFDALKDAGQKGRRVFYRVHPNGKDDYYFMHRRTGSVETIILEWAFIDSSEDMKRMEQNWKKYAEAVIRVLCQQIDISYSAPKSSASKPVQKPDPKPSNPKPAEKPSRELMDAVKKLQDAGIINTPDYWVDNAVKGKECRGDYVSALIIKTAANLK